MSTFVLTANRRTGHVDVFTEKRAVGDVRLDEMRAERPGLLVVGQVRIDARSDYVNSLRRHEPAVSDSDSDIMLFAAGWSVWGGRTPEYALGDYSVAVWEPDGRRVSLVRDRFGVRLLYFARTADTVVASNSLEAVLKGPGVSRAVSEDAIADYLAVGFNEDQATTCYRDVARVRPAHVVVIESAPAAREYWDIVSLPASHERDPVERFRDALTQAVTDRVRAARVAVPMSGGLDSPSIAALAARVAHHPSSVHAITIDLPRIAPSPDAKRAQRVAAMLGISHEVMDGDEPGITEGVRSATSPWQTPEPYDEHDLAVWRTLLDRCAAWSTVLLYGEDPDSLLAPPGIRGLLRGQSLPSVARDALHHVHAQGRRPHLGIRDSVAGLPQPANPDWIRADLRARRAERCAARRPVDHPRAEAIVRLTSPQWQPLFESLDASVIGIPIDARLPYLDVRVVEAALSAAPIPWMQQKHLLREAVKGLLPDDVRLAPKQGLPTHTQRRVAQWRGRNPQPFEPSETLRSLIDIGRLPAFSSQSDDSDSMLELRLRVLDRWLNRSR